ncbi:hypothetical protein BASA81_001986 [Batrachochytrium salamandrivorans]|nr:hypothetical protein BASA81_001986 [Batrachochytrium salamandrivorans]
MASSARLLVSLLLFAEMAIIAPVAYYLIAIERYALDVQSRLPGLLAELEENHESSNEFEFASSFKINMMLLTPNVGACSLQTWAEDVAEMDLFLQSLFARNRSHHGAYSLESSVMFHANTELLLSSQGKQLFQVLDEGFAMATHDNAINLALVCAGNKEAFLIPSWGLVAFQGNREERDQSVEVFSEYVARVVLAPGLAQHAKRDVLRKLGATKTLAEAMPHLPVGRDVCQIPFEQALDILSAEELTLADLQRAVGLANSISTHPSLIPSLYMSNQNLFAVFSPMLLPILFPVLAGLWQQLKRLRSSKH